MLLHVPRLALGYYSEASQTVMQGRHGERGPTSSAIVMPSHPSLFLFFFFFLQLSLRRIFVHLVCVDVAPHRTIASLPSHVPSALYSPCPRRYYDSVLPVSLLTGFVVLFFYSCFFKKDTHTHYVPWEGILSSREGAKH